MEIVVAFLNSMDVREQLRRVFRFLDHRSSGRVCAEDLRVACEAAASGLCDEAEAAMEGDEGVELATCGLHQLRHIEPQVTGAVHDRVKIVREKLERALGVVV